MIFDFLKYCLGGKDNMSNVVAYIDWQQLYSFASKQAILGLCFDGIGRLGKEYSEELKQNPIERELLMTWMGRNMHFVKYYPAEALCEPIFRTWHFFWRMKNKK